MASSPSRNLRTTFILSTPRTRETKLAADKECHLRQNPGIVPHHPVLVNVYDASRFPRLPLIFHRFAVEVLGEEYMFTNVQDGASAVLSGVPGNWGLPLLHSILVGRTKMTQGEVQGEVQHLRTAGAARRSYHPKTNNSRSFAVDACTLILLPDDREPGAALIPTYHPLATFIEPVAEFLTVKAQGRPHGMSPRGAAAETLPVVLNVYEVDPGNRCRPDVRFICIAVEVSGWEFMFTEHKGLGGIEMAMPGFCPGDQGLRRRESVLVGRARAREKEAFEEIVQKLAGEHKYGTTEVIAGERVDWYSKNCNNFARHFCFKLTGNGIPCWLSPGEAPREKAAWWKSPLSCFRASQD